MPVHEPELHKWTKQWVRNACEYVKARPQLTEGRMQSAVYWMGGRHWEPLRRLPGYQESVQTMENDPDIAKLLNTLVGTVRQQTCLEADSLLARLLDNLCREQGSPTYNDQAFERVYESLQRFFYSPKVSTHIIAPLHNFTLLTPEIDFGEGLRIRMLRADEIAELSNECEFARLQQRELRFVGALECEEEKVVGHSDIIRSQPVRHVILDLLSVLRIFKSGVVGYETIHERRSVDDWLGGTGLTSFYAVDYLDWGPEYEIGEAEIEPLKALWQAYRRVDWERHKYLRVAISRLELGIQRMRPEDRIIDYAISLEALFLHDVDDRGELRYRLALRGARFLGETGFERKEIFEQLKRAYDVRSAIVHGRDYKLPKKSDNTEMPISEFVAGVEILVRKSLNKFLALTKERREGPLVDWDRLVLNA